jgi:hypothetical protein
MTERREGPLGNEAAQARLRSREKKRTLLVDTAIKEWMNSPNGRMLFFWLVEDVCNADGMSYAGDSHQTAFNEGVRAVGVDVKRRVQKVDPRGYIVALNEELKRRGENELHLELAQETDNAE